MAALILVISTRVVNTVAHRSRGGESCCEGNVSLLCATGTSKDVRELASLHDCPRMPPSAHRTRSRICHAVDPPPVDPAHTARYCGLLGGRHSLEISACILEESQCSHARQEAPLDQ